MSEYINTYPDLVNVEDWLNAKGYTGEAGACHQAMSLIRKQEKRIAELEAALKDATAHLVAAVSLLERGGKKATPSNKMFEQMLDDHKNSIERGRAAYLGEKND